jgi:hypothetical protein
MEHKNPRAKAIAVKKGKIIKVGDEKTVKRYASKNTEVIDLKKQTVLPGFIDAHGHLVGLGKLLTQIDLTETKSFEQLLKIVENKAKETKPGEWILGRGWNHEKWREKKLPVHHPLSKITPRNPVLLKRIDGHSALCNKLAFKIAGVNENTPDPEGGRFLKDHKNELTGIVIDTAMHHVEKFVPQPSKEELKNLIRLAQRHCIKFGITEVHDAGNDIAQIEAFLELARKGKLLNRVYLMYEFEDFNFIYKNKPIFNIAEGFLSLRAVKIFLDGALGSYGAWLLEPYNDKPTCGFNLTPLNRFRKIIMQCMKRGFQVCIHAIGDRANREALNVLEDVLKKLPQGDYRPRIEHAQILSPEDIPRFSKLGVIASMQPVHAISDMEMAEKRLGKKSGRLTHAYAWREILDSGAKIAAGSDFPIEKPNPLLGIYAAVTRKGLDGKPKNGWFAHQKMKCYEVVRAYTLCSAYASFEENFRGSLKDDKDADFVVLNKDIMKCKPEEILRTKVVMTIIAGNIFSTSNL